MNAKLVEIIRRRERLLMRAATQREELADLARHLRAPAAAIDHVKSAVQTLKAHPVLLAFPLAVLALWRPRRIIAWGGRAWMVWRFWRTSPLMQWFKHAQQ